MKAIPAGGYVRIIGMTNMEEVDPADEPRTFRQAPPGKRLATILAGVTVNLIIAFVLFFVVIAGQGRVYDGPSTTIERIVAGSAAHEAGLETGDKIVGIDGARVDNWDDLKTTIERSGGEQVDLVVVRRRRSRSRWPSLRRCARARASSASAPASIVRDVSVLEAVPESVKTMGSVLGSFTNILSDRLSPSGVSTSAQESFTTATPEAGSTEDLNRPRSLIGIVDTGSDLIGDNMWLLLLMLAQISFVLAVFNLLPILPFDGGHAVDRRLRVDRVEGEAPPGLRRLPQGDPGQRRAAHPHPLPRAVVDGARHPPARSVAGRAHDLVAASRHALALRGRRAGRAAARRSRCSR